MDEILRRLGVVDNTLAGVVATIPHLATKADLSATETSIIKWIIGTVAANAALTFAIAKHLAR